MTSAEIRQSFLDFFASKQHTIVPSASLMPDSPGLLFTNAGMNQFVPIFLGEQAPDVTSWAGAIPSSDSRATDTQKCIRAGGKHNDLEDVGYDTYHHTLFEMLGNWSFGDYFKEESITWGWELLTKVWGIPAKRLFATVYSPDVAAGDPSEFDTEAHAIWKAIFEAEGLDPAVHIVNGNKKDNFWMMGDTGPCGPCSELHFNLRESDDEAEGRSRVNADDPRCIEIWNLVFIQFNANADGTFSPLAAQHVDTGMGFERVAGIYATTNGFTDFTKEPSNYAADVFAPLFAKVTELSGKTYGETVPTKREGLSEQENTDIAFRVLADHARTISCAIADNILPGNEGRNYVIRRILRRGILYGKKLGLTTGFFEQLVPAVVESLGPVFPELIEKQVIIRKVIKSEEESFGRTLERGLRLFEEIAVTLKEFGKDADTPEAGKWKHPSDREPCKIIAGKWAFQLYDTFGFPLDMTQLLATERGLTVDVDGFNELMEQQRDRARAAQKKEVIVAATEGETQVNHAATEFTGYDFGNLTAFASSLVDVVDAEDATYLVFKASPFYAEMGGQAGDAGTATIGDLTIEITDTIKDKAGRFLHKCRSALARDASLAIGSTATLNVDLTRRRAISRHHSATHLIHWALRKVLGDHVHQAGTHKTPERLRFDFAHFEAMTPDQIAEVERLVNAQVIDNAVVKNYETEFDKKPEGTLAFFGEKYGRIVRVVDIGGYSIELCGGTHVQTAGEIGLIKIVAESAIAAGTRRIEAVAGAASYAFVTEHETALRTVSGKLNAGPQDVNQKLDALLAQKAEIEKKLKAFEQKASANQADDLIAQATDRDGLKWVSAVVTAENPNALRALGSQMIGKLGDGIVILGAAFGEKASVVAFCSPAAIAAGHQAGKLVAERSAALGGKGGGKPDFAMGGGREPAKLADVLRLDA
ncbi:alanine--tRNA ligase [Synoicihabitans lomoniglobus]|uniref:Alanine--tRNA ligase n=1 Tax=Synoicihabitans lomoniglobus TaxID=2909285 RepID=A0AAF0CS74_9BACT|nr:alanine--tRNA ligase [Opitutaceae bacterium LMO-M01]WED67076.1 alanine--tRNA ligase [Opitutaceae bacterium LMO-M01]